MAIDAMTSAGARTLVLVSWDGQSDPLRLLRRDADPAFDLILFDYSGGKEHPETGMPVKDILRVKTECKGQIYKAFHAYVATLSEQYDYVALIDDDICVAISALNEAIVRGVAAGLDSFALSLTPDSYCDHRRFIQKAGPPLRTMSWVEVMMPFYRMALFDAAAPFFQWTISSYGLDQFAMPLVCRLTGMANIATIDARSARHVRPVSSGRTVYSNGLTAQEERRAMWRRCVAMIRRDHPRFLATRWYYATYAPLKGPVRFWRLYLLWPVDLVRRLVSARLPRQKPDGSHIGSL